MSEAPTVQTFTTTLLATGGNNVGLPVPDDVVAAFDRGRRVPVVVTIDDGYTYRTTVSSMGGRFLVSFNAETRRATGRGAGDEVAVRLELDDAPRTVDVPPALAAALADRPDAAAAWAALSASRQKAHALSVDGAKTDETRDRRVAKVLESLTA
ncbi:YdeI/OmpD-associated family protein [Isoptericola sp. NPDC057653]|uniref:YdeI/OmpD-associated family protein n=1 Tax=Isoptericola sp. NPDC057653 TaxID=3346195 RepID=UPI00368D6BEB